MTDKAKTAHEADKVKGWRPPTRRVFVQMIAATAAAVALRDREHRPRPIWIGHF